LTRWARQARKGKFLSAAPFAPQGEPKSFRFAASFERSKSNILATIHIDYFARFQTVHEHTNPRHYKLLKGFEAKTGCGPLVDHVIQCPQRADRVLAE